MSGNWSSLDAQDLIMNRRYVGGKLGTLKDEPIHLLLPVGNMGGIRTATSNNRKMPYLVALFTTGKVPEWPDSIDLLNGRIEYWGDNKKARVDMHNTPSGGNRLLRDCFRLLSLGDRSAIPPFFLFEHAGADRDVFFRGLLVPGWDGMPAAENLVAVDVQTDGIAFQNYRARFTVLGAQKIDREWVSELRSGRQPQSHAPSEWTHWVSGFAPQPWTKG